MRLLPQKADNSVRKEFRITMTTNASQSRRTNLASVAYAIAVVLAGVVGVSAWHKWQLMQVQSVTARLTSTGEVIWGRTQIDVAIVGFELNRSADLLRSHGFAPKLIIECYSDTQDADVATLAQVGRDSGFAIVETQRHNWDCPPPDGYPD